MRTQQLPNEEEEGGGVGGNLTSQDGVTRLLEGLTFEGADHQTDGVDAKDVLLKQKEKENEDLKKENEELKKAKGKDEV